MATTWKKFRLRGKFFVSSSALLNLTLPIHNEALSGDELTTIQLNHEWRRIVTSALFYYFKHGTSELALDNEDLLDDVLEDIYTSEITGMLTTLKGFVLPANRTRNLATYAAVADASVAHVFTKPKAVITFYNVVSNISPAGQFGSFRIRMSHGNLDGTEYEWGSKRSDIMAYSGQIKYKDIPPATAVTIFLEFACTGGSNLAMYAAHNTLVRIEEYD